MPLALATAAALEAGRDWLGEAARLRAMLELGIVAAGGRVIAGEAARIATIGAYVMPGVSSAAQLIRFDSMGIAISAGSACSSGSMKPSHVIEAMGIVGGAEMVRVSIGRDTTEAELCRFLEAWQSIAKVRQPA